MRDYSRARSRSSARMIKNPSVISVRRWGSHRDKYFVYMQTYITFPIHLLTIITKHHFLCSQLLTIEITVFCDNKNIQSPYFMARERQKNAGIIVSLYLLFLTVSLSFHSTGSYLSYTLHPLSFPVSCSHTTHPCQIRQHQTEF